MENSMITINKITLVRNGRTIISGYSEQIPAGSITIILGPNGSGKSTLLAAIAGDIAPHEGSITIDERDPQLSSAGFTVRQVIEMAGPSDCVMKKLELTAIADRLVTTLSGGESQRVSIAQAIAQNAPVLLLDEPLSVQDVESRVRIIDLLKTLAESGTTVVVVAHSSEIDLAWADKIIKNFA
ncbi:MAG: iron complex transport system ATP-binding protein [Actinobacteria bacterium]|nr:iron complex transport system ATP-binding protein [Actinomycetota bacterium]